MWCHRPSTDGAERTPEGASVPSWTLVYKVANWRFGLLLVMVPRGPDSRPFITGEVTSQKAAAPVDGADGRQVAEDHPPSDAGGNGPDQPLN